MVNVFLSSPLWGGLFDDEQVAARLSQGAMLARMMAFETAWTQALADLGAIDAQTAARAVAAMEARVPHPDDLAKGAAADGLPVPALVRHLKAGCDAPTAAAIHAGATSQDVIDTAMVLIALDILDLFGDRLSALVARLDALDAQFGARPLMGRTRMQAALPVTVGHRLQAWRQPLAGASARLDGLKRALGVVQVGGPVGLRDAPDEQGDAMAQALAARLGLGVAPVWHSDRARWVDLGHWLVLVTGGLGKLGQDIALMAQQGLDEIRLSGGGTSSAMAHKMNPVRAEILVAQARHVAGQQAILGQALVHEQERSGAAWALEWMALPPMLGATGAALANAAHLLDQITDLGTPAR